MIFQKQCEICKNQFVSKVVHAKYCPECRADAKNLYNKLYAARHGGDVKKSMREVNRLKKRNAVASTPKELQQVTVNVHGKDFTLYQCAHLDMRATTLPCGLREDCYRLRCPHIPKRA